MGWGRRSKPSDPRLCEFLALDDTSGADDRAKMWASDDPFPKVERSLLSSVAIRNYARVTGMVHPFSDARIKAASYEVGMGGSFIYWREGVRTDEPIRERRSVTLPANSISFVQTDVKFRLPNYIGMRFNLQIAHVHRGLLLGTGPLVDPGFEGFLLIPLHNLTSSDYEIAGSKPLIWVEFTKTTFGQQGIGVGYDEACLPNFLFPDRKKNRDADYYLVRANKGNQIASSIPDVIAQAADQAQNSAKEAIAAKEDAAAAKKLAEDADRLLFRIGVTGLLAAVVAVAAIFISALSVVQDSASTIRDAENIIAEAKRSGDAHRADSAAVRQTIARIERLERQSPPRDPRAGTGAEQR